MSIEDRVRDLNGGTYTKKSYSVEEVCPSRFRGQ